MRKKEQQFIGAIKCYANRSHAYLESRTDYGRGYRDGITQCKTTILELLKYFGLNDNE